SFPIFKNNSNREQEKVAAQLAVTLDRLGHNGNGMASTRLSLFWDRSEGSCFKYTDRVLQALLSLEDRYLMWPTVEEREAHSLEMAKKGFIGCVGFVDGTTIPLEVRPGFEGDFYFDRHGDYSFNLQV
ncbi:hypothetical protein BGX21_007714, partial [Mortierella sp. AD011]